MRLSNAFVTRFMEEIRLVDNLQGRTIGDRHMQVEKFLSAISRDSLLREGFELALAPEGQEIHTPDIT